MPDRSDLPRNIAASPWPQTTGDCAVFYGVHVGMTDPKNKNPNHFDFMKNTRSLGHSALTGLAATVLPLLGVTRNAEAQFSITTTTGNTAQNFDTLIQSGTNQSWMNDVTLTPADSTLDGWSLFNSTGAAISAYDGGAGASTAGKFYSFGAAATPERALGGVASAGAYFGAPASGAVAGYIAFGATNNSASTLTGFALGFDGEQWRNGGNTSAQPMVLEYGLGTDFASVTSWSAPGGMFDWSSPVTGATGAAVDGNTAGLVAGRGGSINGLTWATGTTLWLRWIERNDTGSDHGLAIDNFAFSWITGALPKNLTWTPSSSAWNTTATNWQEVGPPSVAFSSGDTVNFTDTGLAGSASVVVDAGGVAPSAVNVSHTAGTYTITGGAIASTGALMTTGDGSLVLGASYSNGLNSTGGVTRTAANEVFGNTATITIGDKASLDLNGNTETVGALNLTGTTISTGTGLLTIGGAVTMTASPTDTPTTISGNLSNGGSTRIYAVADSAAAEDLILNANLTGGGRVNFDGTGTVRIGGDNSAFTGGLQMDSGLTYVLANTKPLGTGQLFLNGGTVEGAAVLTGANALSAAVSLGGNGATFTGANMEFSGALTFFGAGTKTYTVSAGQTVTFSGTLDSTQQPGQTTAPNAAINKAGDGKLVIAGSAAAYDGALTVSAGTADILATLGTGLASIHDSAVLHIFVSQNLADLTIDDGAVVTLSSLPPPAPREFAGKDELAGSLAAVPEPASGILLLGGLATLLGVRRRA